MGKAVLYMVSAYGLGLLMTGISFVIGLSLSAMVIDWSELHGRRFWVRSSLSAL